MAIAIGILGGDYLDSRLGTKPLFFWLGFALGVGAAIKALIDTAKKVKRELESDEPPPPDEN